MDREMPLNDSRMNFPTTSTTDMYSPTMLGAEKEEEGEEEEEEEEKSVGHVGSNMSMGSGIKWRGSNPVHFWLQVDHPSHYTILQGEIFISCWVPRWNKCVL